MHCREMLRSRTCTPKNIAITPPPSGLLHRDRVDVRLASAIAVARSASRPRRSDDEHAHAGIEHALHVGRPFDVDELGRVDALLLERDAIAQVHEQSLALAELADDRVAGNRPAAFRVLDRDTFDAAQRQRARLAPAAATTSSDLAGRRASAPARRRTTAACRGRCRRGSRAGSSCRIPSRALPSDPT